jgi:hypothetical protein
MLDQDDGMAAAALAMAVNQLGATAEDRRQARKVLIRLLAAHPDVPGHPDLWIAGEVARAIAQLDPTAKHKRRARSALVKLMANEPPVPGWSEGGAHYAVEAMAQLDPVAHDLDMWRAWPIPPTVELCATARRNSALRDWLTVLPSLPPGAKPGVAPL